MHNSNSQKKRRNLCPEVESAIHDIMNGTSVDSGVEWLQREYMKLLKREAALKSREQQSQKNESKLIDEIQQNNQQNNGTNIE